MIPHFFKVKGQSMEPFAKEGDFVFVIPFLRPNIGDPAVVKRNGMFLLKRIQRIEGRRYWVEGDNKDQSQDSRNFGWLDQKEVLGKTFIAAKTRH